MFENKTVQTVLVVALLFFGALGYFAYTQHVDYEKKQKGSVGEIETILDEQNAPQVNHLEETCEGLWPEENFATKFIKPIHTAYSMEIGNTVDYENFYAVNFNDVVEVGDKECTAKASVIIYDVNREPAKFLLFIVYSPDMTQFRFDLERERGANGASVFEGGLASLNRKQFSALYNLAKEKIENQ